MSLGNPLLQLLTELATDNDTKNSRVNVLRLVDEFGKISELLSKLLMQPAESSTLEQHTNQINSLIAGMRDVSQSGSQQVLSSIVAFREEISAMRNQLWESANKHEQALVALKASVYGETRYDAEEDEEVVVSEGLVRNWQEIAGEVHLLKQRVDELELATSPEGEIGEPLRDLDGRLSMIEGSKR